MKQLIGRPKDEFTASLICPKCGKQALSKNGVTHFVNKQGIREAQNYRCGNCCYSTTRPINPNGNHGGV